MALTQIKSSNIEDGTVAAADIAADVVDGTKIADDAIDSEHYTDGSIDAPKLAGSIPASKLASTLNLSGKTVTLPAASVTAHAVAAEIGFSNVSGWADSTVKTVTLSPTTAIGKAQVAVYEEIPDTNQTNASWDISTNDTGFSRIDSAYAQTITPAATTGSSVAFTLGAGSWATADIGKIITNNSTSEAGEARIISIASGVATCTITITFTDTNAIASGDWALYSIEFVDGAASLASATTGPSTGTVVVFNSNSVFWIHTGMLSSTKAMLIYKDGTGGYYIVARIIEISGTTVTYGSQVTVYAGNADSFCLAAINATQAVALYEDSNCYAVVLSVSGTTITVNSRVSLHTGAMNVGKGCRLSDTRALFAYKPGGVAAGAYCNLADVSGTTITARTAVLYDSGSSAATNMGIDSFDSTNAVVVFRDVSNSSYGTARHVGISGNTITMGANHVFLAAGIDNYITVTCLSATKAVVAYGRTSDTYAVCQVLDLSGTTISSGDEYVVQSAYTQIDKLDVTAISSTQFSVIYNTNPGNHSSIKVGTVSGTTITYADPYQWDVGSHNQQYARIEKISSTRLLAMYSDDTDTDGRAGVVDLEIPLYVSSQYVTTISGTDSVDTTYYTDWNSNTITETLGGQSAYYAFSVNSTPSAAEVTGGTFMIIGASQTATRNIVSSLSSVHGGTAGVWYKNTNTTYGSATWAAATTNEAKAAIQEATAIAANQMNGTAFAAISDTNLPAFGTQLSVAMTLYSTSNAATPSIDGVSFNYDGNVINRLETDAYTIEMPSTAAIRVTAPSSGGPRNARIYVSS